MSIHIIDVDVVSQWCESGIGLEALSSDLGAESGELRFTVISVESVVEIIIIETVPVGHLEVSGAAIDVPVCATISNHESLEVYRRLLSSLVILINIVRHKWHINASIWFTWNVKFVELEFGEDWEEVHNGI
jgi:hypothetical protein